MTTFLLATLYAFGIISCSTPPNCTHDVSGISLVSYGVITVGPAFGLVDGLLRDTLPPVTANSVVVVLTAAITLMKIVYGRRPSIPQADP